MASIVEGDVSKNISNIEMQSTNRENDSNQTTTTRDIYHGSEEVEKSTGPTSESLSKMKLRFIIIGVASVVAFLSSAITAVIITQNFDGRLDDLITSKLGKMKTSFQQMSEDLVKLTDQAVTPTIVFKARSVVDESPTTGQTLVFSTNILNEGEGYDNTTGIFTAPVSGLYLFTVQFCNYKPHFFYFAIMVDDQPTTISKIGDEDNFSCSSADTIAVMATGMKVWVKCTASGSSIDILYESTNRWNTFSGLLVHK